MDYRYIFHRNKKKKKERNTIEKMNKLLSSKAYHDEKRNSKPSGLRLSQSDDQVRTYIRHCSKMTFRMNQQRKDM